MPDDHTLLLSYARSHDADAFAELVKRYSAMVFSVASRVTGNAATAEDVTQDCFFALARKAASIRVSLPGWLHGVALTRSLQVARNEARRRQHEVQASMPSDSDFESNWDRIAPLIDAALAKLPDELREPVVQHYLLGHTQAKVAEILRIGQATVSRRLHEGVERLRGQLKQAGVVCGAVALSTTLVENALAAVPASLSASLAKMALAGPATVATTASTAVVSSHGSLNLTLIKGALKLMALTKLKTAIVAGVVAMLASGTAIYVAQETSGQSTAFAPADNRTDSTAGGAPDRAMTMFRYKFTPGSVFHYGITQDQNISTRRGGSDVPGNVNNNLLIHMINKVESVDGKGYASIAVLMDRVKIMVKGFDGIELNYDTASQEKSKGSAKLLALIYDILKKQPINIKKSPLGIISDIRISQDLKEAVKKATAAAGQVRGTAPSEEELGNSIKQSNNIIFPQEPIYEGKSWTVNEERKCHYRIGLDAVESVQKIKTTFCYLGKENKDGKFLDAFSVIEELRSPGKITVLTDDKPNFQLKNMSTKGKLYFDNSAGIMIEYNSQAEIQLVCDTYGGTPVNLNVLIVSANTTKLMPADPKAEKSK
jgi:RNA polymerase sigma factor (sigma-70 family)